MKFKLVILFLLSIVYNEVRGQLIDDVSQLRTNLNQKSFRFYYDNDFFSASDQYYTQGINLEFQSPQLQKNPLDHLLLYYRSQYTIHGISLEHNVFTPSSIRHTEILFGDYPYSAYLILKSFVRSYNFSKESALSSAISIGVIGPAAFGGEMQTGIHHALSNLPPLGWKHQIKNDLIINYQLVFEKNVIHAPNHFLLAGIGEAHLGTLYDKLNTGIEFHIGKFNEQNVVKNKFEFTLYGQSELSYHFYDATKQGGVFNSNNDYTLVDDEIKKITLENKIGLLVRLNKIQLEYFQSYNTKEIALGVKHNYGGISIGYFF